MDRIVPCFWKNIPPCVGTPEKPAPRKGAEAQGNTIQQNPFSTRVMNEGSDPGLLTQSGASHERGFAFLA